MRAPWVVEHEDSVNIHLSANGLKDGCSCYDEAPTGLILYAVDKSINFAEEQPVHVQTAIRPRQPKAICANMAVIAAGE